MRSAKLGICALCLAPAVSCVKRVQTVAAPGPSAFERQIANAVDAGDGDFGLRALRRRMAEQPGSIEIRLEIVRRLADTGHPDLALEHSRLAAERFPDSVDLHSHMALQLRALGLKQEAARTLGAFLDAYAQSQPDPYSWLGILRDENGDFTGAEQAHRAALALAPDSDALHNNLGYCLLLQKRHEEAAEEFRRALELRPHSETARNNLGLALAAQPGEAIVHWQSVTDPATAHSNMAALLIQQGRYADARKELDLALGYNRQHAAALNNLRLVSKLDGKPAFLPLRKSPTTWGRLRSAVRKAAGG